MCKEENGNEPCAKVNVVTNIHVLCKKRLKSLFDTHVKSISQSEGTS